MPVDQINLFQAIKTTGFHSSIATTYSVDGSFYDGPVQGRLRQYGCVNNILIADVSMLSRALNASPGTFPDAGRKYALVAAKVNGCFHPKLLLRLGEKEASLFVSSANMTSAGWGRNLEVTGAADYRVRDSSPTGPLIRKAYDYLGTWLSTENNDTLTHKLHVHFRQSPWLADLEPNTAPVVLPDGSYIDLLCETGSSPAGILERFVGHIDGEKIKRVVVISPYWDQDLGALQDLNKHLGGPRTYVALNPKSNDFPLASLKKQLDLSFTPIPAVADQYQFVHAKVVIVSTDRADHVLYGSANVSEAALGRFGKGGGHNAEASVYRRHERGRVISQFGLDLSEKVSLKSIAQSKPSKFELGGGRVMPGTVELRDKILRWIPADGIDGDNAVMLHDGGEVSMLPGDAFFRGLFEGEPATPFIVRFKLADGRETEPTIVHDVVELNKASPGKIDSGIDRALRRFEEGDGDLADLISEATRLFDAETRGRGGGGGMNRPPANAPAAIQYDNEEDFRNGVIIRNHRAGNDNGLVPGFMTKDLTLFALFRIMGDTYGIEVPDLAKEHLHEIEELKRRKQDTLAGENEDGAEKDAGTGTDNTLNSEDDGDEDEPAAEQAETQCAQTERPRGISAKDFRTRRNRMERSFTQFDEMLSFVREKSDTVELSLLVKTSFLLHVMMWAVRTPIAIQDREPDYYMVLASNKDDDREATFVVRAPRVLDMIWLRKETSNILVNSSIVDRIHRHSGDAPPPMELQLFVVMSRWLMIRSCLAAEKAKMKTSFLDILSRKAREVIAASRTLITVDPDFEKRVIQNADAKLTFSPADTEELLQRIG